MIDRNNGYILRLANDQGWHITATEDLNPWAAKLASIMELKSSESNGYPKLIFIQRKPRRGEHWEPTRELEKGIKEALPRRGWKAREGLGFRLWSHREVNDVICEIKQDENHETGILMMRLSLYPVYHRAQKSGGLPLHAGLVQRDGSGFLLAASSETGKSTCCRRLYGKWFVLGDEETLILLDKHKQYQAHPFPTWSEHLNRVSERTWNVQQYVPLSAIFFLEQADNDEVIPIGQGKAAAYINKSARQAFGRTCCYINREESRIIETELFDTASKLAKRIPTFILRVSLQGRFWEEIEKVL